MTQVEYYFRYTVSWSYRICVVFSVFFIGWYFLLLDQSEPAFEPIVNRAAPTAGAHSKERVSSVSSKYDYFEDFSDGESQFFESGLIYNNGWMEKTKSSVCVLPRTVFTDFIYSADIKTVGGDALWQVASMVFRFTEDNDYYLLMIGSDNVLKFKRLDGDGEATVALHSLDASEYLKRDSNGKPSISVWNSFKVKCQGKKIDGYINERMVFSVSDANPILEGAIGIKSHTCTGFFDNIEVIQLK